MVNPDVDSKIASTIVNSGKAKINGNAHIKGTTHHKKFTTNIPNLADILGVSPLVANKIKIHPKPAVKPDHRKGSPPFQPTATEASQGINISVEKNSPTSATIWLADLNSFESIFTSSYLKNNNYKIKSNSTCCY